MFSKKLFYSIRKHFSKLGVFSSTYYDNTDKIGHVNGYLRWVLCSGSALEPAYGAKTIFGNQFCKFLAINR